MNSGSTVVGLSQPLVTPARAALILRVDGPFGGEAETPLTHSKQLDAWITEVINLTMAEADVRYANRRPVAGVIQPMARRRAAYPGIDRERPSTCAPLSDCVDRGRQRVTAARRGRCRPHNKLRNGMARSRPPASTQTTSAHE